MAKLTRAQFIAKLAPFAVACMRKMDISAALTLAQGCLESADGNSGLTTKANNLFGIKGKGDAGSIVMPTKEQRSDGSEYTINASFAAYSSWGACVDAKAKLLLNGVSWNRNLYKPVLGKRGKDAAYEIQACGYATDVRYAQKLIDIMDAHNLYKYDLEAEEQPMTAAEQKAFEAMGKKVNELESAVTTLTMQLAAAKEAVPPPKWFVAEFECEGQPSVLARMSDPVGTVDFWRALAVSLRMQGLGKGRE